jgi:outer membrane protein assembly factor BamA
MLFRRQVNVSFLKPAPVLIMAISIFIFSCVAPKKGQYPKNKPFVFKTNIKVEGKLPKDEKQDLQTRLANQLDDSLHARTVTAFRIWPPPFVYRKLPNPPVFDTANAVRSINFMVALLNSVGYYNPTIKDSIKIDTIKDQYRAIVNFKVYPGKSIKIDSIGYDLQTPELQALVLKNKNNSVLKKGKPFSKQLVSSELERLITLFRNNGYYKFSIKDIYAERDTVLSALIDPTLDPFQQAQLLEELKKKRENPTINVVIKQRPPQDSSELQKYYIDSITVYSDLPLIEDTAAVIKNDTVNQGKISVISRTDRFKPSVVYRNLVIKPGNVYKLDDYYKTLNVFGNQMGAWQRTTLDYKESPASDSLLNASISLFPAQKQTITSSLEASYNTNDILTATNLFGVGADLSLRNRNAYQRSIQTNTSLRAGVEFGADFIQTTETNLSHTIAFPHITPSNLFKSWDNKKTVLNFNAAYTDRRDFFSLRSIEASLGWEGTVKNHSWTIRPFNIEYTTLSEKGDSLDNLIKEVPSLRLAFRTGLVVGEQIIYSYTKQHDNHINIVRVTGEESGFLYGVGTLKALNMGGLSHFVKADIEYRHRIDYKGSQLAFRAYAGYGLAYGNGLGTAQTLPFYKAFFAGGPNSMRGWQVRQLGLGSSYYYDTSAIDKFGDIKLEGNVEYRFNLGTIYGIKIGSAIYTDIGNIWNRNIPATDSISIHPTLKGSDFEISRFYNEFAVDAGTGLRLDFDYFIIRFDWAYIIRDPRRLDYPNRWFYDMQLKNGQFQLGIGYPF